MSHKDGEKTAFCDKDKCNDGSDREKAKKWMERSPGNLARSEDP